MTQLRTEQDRGAAAVEFALIALLLLTMVFAVIEGGRLFVMQASLSSAAREAAREVAIRDTPDPQGRLDDGFRWGAPTITDLDSCPAVPDPMANQAARVEATFTTPLMGPIGPGSVTLTGVGVMRCGG